MTKRPSPFEPSVYRQFKIHLNNFENDLKALKSVEVCFLLFDLEETLKKLKDGSRKSHTIILNIKDYSNCENDAVDKSSNFMQKCLTNYITVNGKKLNEKEKVFINCLETISKCSFCDSNRSSLHQCIECLEFYCSSCSFIVYESSEDKRVCLSCS